MKFREHNLAHKLLDGLRGLEIGAAAYNPFGLNTRNVAPPDGFEFYARSQEDEGEEAAPVHIWAVADAIPVPDNSEDFILSSHVVEHLPDVIGAFREWDRIVRPGGFVFMIVPIQGALPADAERPITSLEHLVEDYRKARTLDTHPTEGVPGGRMGHYHVFTPDSLLRMVRWMRQERLCDWQLILRENRDTKVCNGFTLAFRVRSKPGQRSRPAGGILSCRIYLLTWQTMYRFRDTLLGAIRRIRNQLIRKRSLVKTPDACHPPG